MNYVKYTYVDSVTGIPVNHEPAINGPTMPNITGLQFDFALESEYPVNTSIMYGTCAGIIGDVLGVLEVLTRADFDNAKAAELSARNSRYHAETVANIADRRWRSEIAGTALDGRRIETDRTAVAMVTSAALAASLDPAYSVRWKSADGFVTLNAEQIIGLAQAIRTHVQASFDREAELLDALEAGDYEPDMLETGWPDLHQQHDG